MTQPTCHLFPSDHFAQCLTKKKSDHHLCGYGSVQMIQFTLVPKTNITILLKPGEMLYSTAPKKVEYSPTKEGELTWRGKKQGHILKKKCLNYRC